MNILASKKLKAWKNTEACVRPFFPAAAVNSLKGKYYKNFISGGTMKYGKVTL